jgi:hypothetical protein
MKKLLLILLLSTLYIQTQTLAQGITPPGTPIASAINVTYPQMNAAQVDSIKKATVNSIFSNPDLYNDAFAQFINSLKGQPNMLYTFMRDMNIKFKTFQVNNQSPALGFEYDYNNSWTKNKQTPTKSIVQSYNISLNGNVAFKKADNPTNLMVSSFLYNGTFIWGGVTKKNDTATAKRLIHISKQIAQNTTPNNPAIEKLYEEQNQLIKITNQYYLGININTSFENTQDFSKQQFVPGFLVNAGAKAWDKNEALQYFNLPDYPFALLRLITGTDDSFQLSGASFPSALMGIDYVIPNQDSLRQAVTGALNPFSRFRFEASFKTKAARLGNKPIYFSSDFRWYRELFATSAELRAGIANQLYFVATLESNNGFFVSYTAGRLPFDKANNSIYGLGFHYNFGNWQ